MFPEIYDLTFRLEENYWWYVGRREIICTLMDQFAPQFRDASGQKNGNFNVLDYGCGTGIMLGVLENYGRVWGVDFSEHSVEFCRKRGHENVNLLTGPESMAFDPGFFGVITLLDVLEHVHEEVDLLEKLKTLLNPKGRLFVTVPAYQWLWSGEDYVSQHLRRYTKKSLENVLRQAGFDLIKTSYFNSWLLLPQAAVIIFKKIAKRDALFETDIMEVPKWANWTLTQIFSSEKFFLKRGSFPFGGSILGIATPMDA